MPLNEIARYLAGLPVSALLAQKEIRRRIIFALELNYFAELDISVPLSLDLFCPVTAEDHWHSFAEIFIHREYASVFNKISLPTRWIDLGCHAGYFSLFVIWLRAQQKLSSDCKALLVDADPRVSQGIEKLVSVNHLGNNIVFKQGAVASGRGERNFNLRNVMASSVAEIGSVSGQPTSVSIVTEDELMKLLPAPYDLIKCDIEGMEYDFLIEYKNVLSASRYLLLEWHSWHKGGGGAEQIVELAKSTGFNLIDEPMAPHAVHLGTLIGDCGVYLFEKKAPHHIAPKERRQRAGCNMDIGKIINALPHPLRRHSLIQLLLKLYPGSKIQLLQFNDSAKALVDLNDAAARQYLIKGIFEPEFFTIAAPFLARGGVFFDVGANFGLCTFGLIAALEGVVISYHLFEANEEICTLLSRSALVHKDTKIQINWCSISDGPGTSCLQIVKGELGQSFISPEGCQTVNNLTLDRYIQTNAIKRVNLMKIDIEGYEPLALRGARASLEQGIFDAIYLEVSTSNLARNTFRPTDCLDLLKKTGFELFHCKPVDFQILSLEERSLMVSINGYPLKVAPLIQFPDPYHTDILAVHHQSGFRVNL